MNVRVQSATGGFHGIRVMGTLNLVNVIKPHPGGTPSVVPLRIQVNLKPAG